MELKPTTDLLLSHLCAFCALMCLTICVVRALMGNITWQCNARALNDNCARNLEDWICAVGFGVYSEPSTLCTPVPGSCALALASRREIGLPSWLMTWRRRGRRSVLGDKRRRTDTWERRGWVRERGGRRGQTIGGGGVVMICTIGKMR